MGYSTSVGVKETSWDAKKQQAKPDDKDSKIVNDKIDSLLYRVHKAKLKLDDEGKEITIDHIKYLIADREKEEKTILTLFKKHNMECEQKVGVLLTQATYERYVTCYNHVEEFIKHEYKSNDLSISEINRKFYEGLELFLKKERKCAHNTAVKYVRNFNKITRMAVEMGWLVISPYKDLNYRLQEVDKPYLTKEELEIISEKEIAMTRLSVVRDMFLVGCYTGLAFSDIKELTEDDIQTGVDGNLWIIKNRKKTGIVSKIPLLNVPQRIIEKYKDHPKSGKAGSLLPIPTNQKMNAYLKEIADVCGIKKLLTTHTARRSFATTIMLQNGVSMEAVSKMLGHTSLFMTRKYAKTDEYYIAMETQNIRNLFSST